MLGKRSQAKDSTNHTKGQNLRKEHQARRLVGQPIFIGKVRLTDRLEFIGGGTHTCG